MSSRGALAFATLSACLLLSCDAAPSAQDRPALLPRSEAPEGLPARTQEPSASLKPSQPALPRTADCHAKDARGEDVGARELMADTVLYVAEAQRCKLVYPAGAVATLHGPARALAAPRGEAALLVREGLLEIDLAPSAVTPESGFVLATPGFALELVQGGRLVVRVAQSGESLLAVVSGQARIQPAGEGERGRHLRPGQALAISAEGVSAERVARLVRLEDALAWARAQPVHRGDASVAQAALTKRVEATLALALEETQRTEALTRQHAEQTPGAPRAMALQAELSKHVGQAEARRRLLKAQVLALESWLLGESVNAAEGRGLSERARALWGH